MKCLGISLGLSMLLAGPLAWASGTSVPQKLKVSASGIGPFNAKTRATPERIQQLLPGTTVKALDDHSEGEVTGHRFEVSNHGKLSLVIHTGPEAPGKIFSIEVRDAGVVGPAGARVGDPLGRLEGLSMKSCERGGEEEAAQVHCWVSPHRNILYVADVNGRPEIWNGPDSEVPPLERLKTLPIEAIVWKPAPIEAR